MADGRKQCLETKLDTWQLQQRHTDICTIVNQARALRLAELMNDYRTLLLHIPQQDVEAPPEDYWEEGYVVIRECMAAAQNLMSANYAPSPSALSSGTHNDVAEMAELQR